MSDDIRTIIYLVLSYLCFGGCVCFIWLAVLVNPLFAFLAFLLLMVTLILSVLLFY